MALGVENGLALAIIADGNATALYTDIFVGEEPPSPDNIITVLESPGGRIINQITEAHIITVRVRNENYEDGKGLLHDISLGLVAFSAAHQGRLIGTIPAQYIRATAPGVPLGRDEGPNSGRWRFSQTFEVVTKQRIAYS